LQTELTALKKEIAETQRALDKINPEFKKTHEVEQDLRAKYDPIN